MVALTLPSPEGRGFPEGFRKAQTVLVEAEWERIVPCTDFDLKSLQSLVEPYGIAVALFAPILEGKANTNLRLVTDKGESLLFRSHQRAPFAGALESAISLRLAPSGILPEVFFYDAEQAFSLVEWREGVTMERLLAGDGHDEVVRAAPSIGRALATIEGVRFPAAGELNPRLEVAKPWPSAGVGLGSYVEFLLSQPRVQERLSEGEIVRLERLTRRLAEEIDAATPWPVLVHGDYKASNLLVHEGRLSGVLDWEFAHAGSSLLSIAQLFRHPLPDGFESGFVEGYGEGGGVLPEGWRKLARSVDLVNLLDFLNRDGVGEVQVRDVRRLMGES